MRPGFVILGLGALTSVEAILMRKKKRAASADDCKATIQGMPADPPLFTADAPGDATAKLMEATNKRGAGGPGIATTLMGASSTLSQMYNNSSKECKKIRDTCAGVPKYAAGLPKFKSKAAGGNAWKWNDTGDNFITFMQDCNSELSSQLGDGALAKQKACADKLIAAAPKTKAECETYKDGNDFSWKKIAECSDATLDTDDIKNFMKDYWEQVDAKAGGAASKMRAVLEGGENETGSCKNLSKATTKKPLDEDCKKLLKKDDGNPFDKSEDVAEATCTLMCNNEFKKGGDESKLECSATDQGGADNKCKNVDVDSDPSFKKAAGFVTTDRCKQLMPTDGGSSAS